MRHAFANFFMFFTTLFSAANRIAVTADNYAKWAEGESAAFEELSSIERQARLRDTAKELGVTLKSVA